ncbi:MAG: hypothetical protein HY875_07185 [Chloroflexi bacterium]|nr:hypothetical protein [Chloroflexota bacterium]
MNEAPRVVAAGLRQFQCAYDGYVEAPYELGRMVAVREGSCTVLGIVVDSASGPEDPARPLQPPSGAGGRTAAEVLADNPHIRPLLTTAVTVVACGHIQGEDARATLPPMPPPLLAEVAEANPEEVAHLAQDAAFLSLLVASPACDDSVIAAAVRLAATAFGPGSYAFTVRAGKELARLLKAEPARLTSIIRGVAP